MVDYGTDISCAQDLDPYFGTVTGAEGVAQALARRLQTPLGGLLTDPTYGFDLRALLNSSFTRADVLALQSSIESQCLLDERVDSVGVDVSLPVLNGAATVQVSPVLVDGETFNLTFEISTSDSSLVFSGVEWPDGSVSA
jgi:phage baseplate assembly protein W